MNVNLDNEIKLVISNLKDLLSDAQNRIGILESFLYMAKKENESQKNELKETKAG